MENMSTIFMYLDAINFLSVDVASNMAAFFNYLNALATLSCFVGKSGSK